VSMPRCELFELQEADYRDEVLPPDVRARVSVEPGVALGWRRWVGDYGDSIALEQFGASAPGTTVLERLGFNVDNVVARAVALLERVASGGARRCRFQDVRPRHRLRCRWRPCRLRRRGRSNL